MRSSSAILVVSCLLAVYLGVVLATSTSNLLSVEDLPGYQGDAPDLEMYTGYITVDEEHGRNLFYWHVKSLNDPDNDPLVFWYNGGPGCSGLGGFFTENGPFTVDTNLSLVYNTLHWANIANVVWLEQPAGVGFSYSEDPNDYFTNDTRAAQDNYAFIQGFLQLYPEYQSTNIWLAGESYAGIYIPTLTSMILDGPNQYVKTQLTGLMLGNPVNLCPAFDYVSVQYNIYYWHGLVSPSNYQNWTNNNCDIDASSDTCNEIFNIAQEQIGSIVQELTPFDNEPSLDPDDLYQDFCTGNGTLEFSLDINDTIDSCYPVGQRVQDYLNQDEVQTVLTAVPTEWVDCTNNINYTSENLNMNPHLQQAFAAGLQVLIYAGDVDIATVPAWYTVPCINTLGSNVIEEWQPWFVNGATAGYVTVYEDFTWATLKGAGHEAPEYQPLDAFNLFSRFLNGDSDLQDAVAPRKVDLSKARLAKRLLTQGMQARKIYASSRRS